MPPSARPTLQSIPQGARSPAIPSPIDSWTPYLQAAGSPEDYPSYRPYSASSNTGLRVPEQPIGRSSSLSETGAIPFPEPQLGRSVSYASSLLRGHRRSSTASSTTSTLSRSESLDYVLEADTPGRADYLDTSGLSQELSNLTVDSDEGLRQFQSGLLHERDEEWYKLVPVGAQDALGKKEVERQSVIFEIFKAEKDYVNDLVLVKEVFIDPLLAYDPPVMKKDRLKGFVKEVFYNFESIAAHHQRMLSSLFGRQREQHPLVQSVADIVLDTCLLFRDDYEEYIKHYPLAEARHRAELKRNREYQYFMQQQAQDPRVRKHDLATFLSRPVTRLPRLSLVLEHLLKITDVDHPDQESLPLILSILSDFIKSTQPGIESADSKAKFWDLCESLVYVKGEIIDMDLYDEKRTLVHASSLARRQRSEMDWHGWHDLHVAVLDNYFLMTKEETRVGGIVKRHVVSRPIPLEYLRLGDFSAPAEARKERLENGSRLLSFRSEYKSMFPFTVYHAASTSSRRYTLFAPSEAARQKWHEALSEALVIRGVNQETNMLFAPQTIHDGFFRAASARMALPASSRFTGRITCAATFGHGTRRFLVVGCISNIYIAQKGMPWYHKVMPLTNATSMSALPEFDKLVVHQNNTLFTCSLEALARAALSGAQTQHKTEVPYHRLTNADETVMFFRVGKVGNRTMLIYAVKGLLSVNLHALEAVSVEQRITAQRGETVALSAFRTFGEPASMPKDIHDITPLVRTIAVCGEKGILVVDPTNLSKSTMTMVPDFRGSSNNLPMSTLKARCDGAKPLGIARCDASELLVVYDELGCYVTKHGQPSRSSGYVRWEARAHAFAHRGRHLLLFSSGHVEIREVGTGRLVQVLAGADVRLLHTGLGTGAGDGKDELLAVMRGDKDDRDGTSEKIVEFLQTAELERTPSSARPSQGAWDEWDMAG